MIKVRVDGTPGPKGSVAAFCMNACCRRKKPNVVLKEQSGVGVNFRKAVARAAAGSLPTALTEPIQAQMRFYIPRRYSASGIVWPSHDTAYPIHRNSGDLEKHVRTVNDALQDAKVIADDSQVWSLTAEKRWADEEHCSGLDLVIGP